MSGTTSSNTSRLTALNPHWWSWTRERKDNRTSRLKTLLGTSRFAGRSASLAPRSREPVATSYFPVRTLSTSVSRCVMSVARSVSRYARVSPSAVSKAWTSAPPRPSRSSLWTWRTRSSSFGESGGDFGCGVVAAVLGDQHLERPGREKRSEGRECGLDGPRERGLLVVGGKDDAHGDLATHCAV